MQGSLHSVQNQTSGIQRPCLLGQICFLLEIFCQNGYQHKQNNQNEYEDNQQNHQEDCDHFIADMILSCTTAAHLHQQL
jgi:hypothetical protein